MEIALIVAVVLMAVAILALAVALRRPRQPGFAPMDERLDSLNRGLGEVKADTVRMLEVGEDMRTVLGTPTLRGGLGERMLEAQRDGNTTSSPNPPLASCIRESGGD